ncbi:hypothetical protein C8J57DRAFT_184459 [Mycena rebaudengoi]|nr:hypothetical protein C8J57DRAFT_184459 [Mycena rebaudengoi]
MNPARARVAWERDEIEIQVRRGGRETSRRRPRTTPRSLNKRLPARRAEHAQWDAERGKGERSKVGRENAKKEMRIVCPVLISLCTAARAFRVEHAKGSVAWLVSIRSSLSTVTAIEITTCTSGLPAPAFFALIASFTLIASYPPFTSFLLVVICLASFPISFQLFFPVPPLLAYTDRYLIQNCLDNDDDLPSRRFTEPPRQKSRLHP